MKKLMFAAAVAAAGGLMAIESANVVGYASNNMGGNQYIQVGNAFLNADSTNKEFRLSVISPSAYDSSSDILQLVSAVNARTIDQYVYITAIEADGDTDLIGWWDTGIETSKNDLTFDIGQGFKGNFAAKDVQIVNAGGVNMDATEVDYRGKQYVVIPNILPRQVLLGEIVGIGTDSSSDIVQKLNPANARTTDQMVYVSAAEADGDTDLIGWWDTGIETPKNNVAIDANGALYANFAAKGVKLAFPAATTAAPSAE